MQYICKYVYWLASNSGVNVNFCVEGPILRPINSRQRLYDHSSRSSIIRPWKRSRTQKIPNVIAFSISIGRKKACFNCQSTVYLFHCRNIVQSFKSVLKMSCISTGYSSKTPETTCALRGRNLRRERTSYHSLTWSLFIVRQLLTSFHACYCTVAFACV